MGNREETYEALISGFQESLNIMGTHVRELTIAGDLLESSLRKCMIRTSDPESVAKALAAWAQVRRGGHL